MEFNDCLFIASATTGSVLPFKQIYGRINTIELTSINITPKQRIARYTVCYWLANPVDTDDDGISLSIMVDGLPHSEFYVEIPPTILTLNDIEKFCCLDFLNRKLLGNDLDIVKKLQYNQSQRLKRIDGFYLKASNSSLTVNSHFVKSITHVTQYAGNNRDPLSLVKSVAVMTDPIGSTELNVDYTPSPDWVREAARQWVSPNTLRAIHTQRNSYQ